MKRLLLLILAGLFLTQAGCGGGGGGGPAPAANSQVSGMAVLGIIKNGDVKVYALNSDGSRGSLLAATKTDALGNYSADLGTYSGPVMAYAYGSYVDEATGQTVTLSEQNAIRAALPQASGTVSLSITGLTDLAVQKANPPTPAAVAAANTLISSVFKVDITGTKPVDATAAAMGATTDKARIDYTLALAGLSQLASTTAGATPTDKLHNAIAALAAGINGTITSQTANTFANAVNTYLDNHSDIDVIIANNGGSPIITVGAKQAVVKIALSGAPGTLSGGQFVLMLPAGVTVKSDTSSAVLNGVIGLTSTTTGALVVGKYTAATSTAQGSLSLAVAKATAIGNGTFLIVNADLADGATVTKDSFAIAQPQMVDQNGAAVAGTLAVSDVTLQ